MIERISMVGTKNQVFENRQVRLIRISTRALIQKDVNDEDWSSEFIENKGAKKVVLRVF
jgi:hypothetical protein